MQENQILYPTYYLNNDKCFGDNFERINDAIHALVDLDQFLTQCYNKRIEQNGFMDCYLEAVDYLVEPFRS
ncbi:hypothetical protein DVH05_017443 [Phytophthora capsici]|nr:hypothetical protein DVH05_017443 [Phytophthora capsici]